jgi:hypothetical protein
MIARFHLSHESRGDGSHTGSGCPSGLNAFKGGHPRFEHRNRRVREAGIDIAGQLVLEPRLAFLSGVVDMALSQKERFRRLAKARPEGAVVNQAGFGVENTGGRRRFHHDRAPEE